MFVAEAFAGEGPRMGGAENRPEREVMKHVRWIDGRRVELASAASVYVGMPGTTKTCGWRKNRWWVRQRRRRDGRVLKLDYSSESDRGIPSLGGEMIECGLMPKESCVHA